jgi:hypothetical protein
MRYDKTKRVFMVEKYLETKSIGLVQKSWRTKFKNEPPPDYHTIRATVQRFTSTGSVASLPPTWTKPNERREAAREHLKTLVSEDSSISVRKASAIVGVSTYTVHNILREDLHLKPYKIHEWHKLEEADYQKRINVADFFKGLPKNALSFLICCDEAYFYLTPPVNSQNYRMWLESKPSDKIERPLHDEKVLVWCAISDTHTYGPYFFEESVNQLNYLDMLENFFWQRHCHMPSFQKYYFAQDGATPHTANAVQNYLKSKFSKRFFDKSMWPPRSPDLNPCDFFLWGYLKDRVYDPMPESLDSLKSNIEREFKKISKDMLKSVFCEFSKRLDKIQTLKGAHVEEK